MMLGDKQEQSAEANAVALQAGRDIHYHGLTLADVREVCSMYLEHNFPRLQHEARMTAEGNVREFANILSKEIDKQAATVLVDKFKDPDVQAALNDAIAACARRGSAASPELLSQLLVSRMAAETTPFQDVVISETIQVVPKLTPQQMGFLAFSFAMKRLYPGIVMLKYSNFEYLGKKLSPIVEIGWGLSDTQKLHLVYAGALAINAVTANKPYVKLFEKFKSIGGLTLELFSSEIASNAPTYDGLLKKMEENEVYLFELTSVGEAIAITLLSPAFPGLKLWDQIC